jgi:hypothetical protein
LQIEFICGDVVGTSGRIRHLELLSPADRAAFECLRAVLSAPDVRYNRNQRLPLMWRALSLVRSFCTRGQRDDWLRCLVCGICWLDGEMIAANTKQLRHVLGRSKSSINGSLTLMNYVSVPACHRDVEMLCTAIPFLACRRNELRLWTIRRAVEQHEQDVTAEDSEQQQAAQSAFAHWEDQSGDDHFDDDDDCEFEPQARL